MKKEIKKLKKMISEARDIKKNTKYKHFTQELCKKISVIRKFMIPVLCKLFKKIEWDIKYRGDGRIILYHDFDNQLDEIVHLLNNWEILTRYYQHSNIVIDKGYLWLRYYSPDYTIEIEFNKSSEVIKFVNRYTLKLLWKKFKEKYQLDLEDIEARQQFMKDAGHTVS